MRRRVEFHARPLDDVRDPVLAQAVEAFRRAGEGDALDVAALVSQAPFAAAITTLFLVEGDDVRDWLVAWQSANHLTPQGENWVGRRQGDHGDRAYADESALRMARIVEGAEPACDDVTARIGGVPFRYRRLALPLLWDGKVDALLTVTRPLLAVSGGGILRPAVARRAA